jgi:hypothetical protein
MVDQNPEEPRPGEADGSYAKFLGDVDDPIDDPGDSLKKGYSADPPNQPPGATERRAEKSGPDIPVRP